jgi:hypothetical protein
VEHKLEMKEAEILTQMGAIIPVSAINRMVIRGLNIVIAAEVCMFAPVSALFRQSNSTFRWVRE